METDDMSAVREVRLAYENVKVVDCLDLTPEGNASWEAALKRYVRLYTLQTSYCYLKIFQSGMLALFVYIVAYMYVHVPEGACVTDV